MRHGREGYSSDTETQMFSAATSGSDLLNGRSADLPNGTGGGESRQTTPEYVLRPSRLARPSFVGQPMFVVPDPDAYRIAVGSVRLVRAQLPEIVDMLQPIWKPERDGAPPTVTASAHDILTKGRPVRRTVGKSTVRRSGYFSSRKNRADGALAWESELEKHALWLLECDPNVTRFITQPLTVTYVVDRKLRRHTPDLWWWRGEHPYIAEIKPAWHLKRPDTAYRTQLMTDVFASHGIRYRVWGDDEIRDEPRLSNAKYLLRFRDQAVTREQKWIARGLLERRGATTIRDLADAIGLDGREAVLAMVLRGYLLCDLHEPLSLHTAVWLKPECDA